MQFCAKNIQLIGADFGYLDGKPYCKGTYLDHLYNQNTSKLTNSETLFSKLMFRTELIDINSIKKTTTVLVSYRISFEDFIFISLIFNFVSDYSLQCKNATVKNWQIFLHFQTCQAEKSTTSPQAARHVVLDKWLQPGLIPRPHE